MTILVSMSPSRPVSAPLSPLSRASLVFRDNFDELPRRFPVEIGADGIAAYRYDLSQNVLRPFVTLTYWFEISLEGGQTVRSPNYTCYLDDRFTWQQRSGRPAGALVRGRSRLWGRPDGHRPARPGQGERAPAGRNSPVDVYVYASPGDLQSALFLGGESWQAGHANPKLNVVLVAVSPGLSRASRWRG